jgi:hypothetical protein
LRLYKERIRPAGLNREGMHMTVNRKPNSAPQPVSPRRLFLGAFALALASTACTSTAERVASPDAAVRALVVRPSGPSHHLTAECTGEARPDRVVIAGGMTAQSASPLDAQAQLDRQLAELRKYVHGENGRLDLLERVRAAGMTGGGGSTRGSEVLPFLALQRLEIEFPASIDIDAAFERVLHLGMDRFGSNIRVDRVDRNRRVVVRYRFSALREELDRIHDRCRAEATARWCSAEGMDHAVCALPAGERNARVKTRALNLRTQQLLNERGGVSTYYLNYPWRASRSSGSSRSATSQSSSGARFSCK